MLRAEIKQEEGRTERIGNEIDAADGTQVIMVTSAAEGEGKTTLSSLLADSLARAGRKCRSTRASAAVRPAASTAASSTPATARP